MMKGRPCTPEPRSISIALRSALSRYNAIFGEEAGRAKANKVMTPLQLAVLGALVRGDMSQKELRAQASTDRSTLSEMVIRLRRIGLVEFSKAKGDGRMTIVKITPDGKKAFEAGVLAASRAERRFLGPITDKRLTGLRNILEGLGTG